MSESTGVQEQSINHEIPTRGDLVTAALYTTAFALERDREMVSGMMSDTNEEGLAKAVNDLMTCETAQTTLDVNERSLIESQMSKIFNAMNKFKNIETRDGYETSYPGHYDSRKNPNQVGNFVPQTGASPTPQLDVYMVNNGDLMYRTRYDQDKVRNYGDKTDKQKVDRSGIIDHIEPLSSDVVGKLVEVVKSDSFSKKWDEIQSGLSYEPKAKLNEVIALDSVR